VSSRFKRLKRDNTSGLPSSPYISTPHLFLSAFNSVWNSVAIILFCSPSAPENDAACSTMILTNTPLLTKHRCPQLRFGTGRQRMVLERWTNPERSSRACAFEHGLQSWRGESAGVAKRPKRSPTRNPYRSDSQLLRRCTARRLLSDI
jgi:hypothetical protein